MGGFAREFFADARILKRERFEFELRCGSLSAPNIDLKNPYFSVKAQSPEKKRGQGTRRRGLPAAGVQRPEGRMASIQRNLGQHGRLENEFP